MKAELGFLESQKHKYDDKIGDTSLSMTDSNYCNCAFWTACWSTGISMTEEHIAELFEGTPKERDLNKWVKHPFLKIESLKSKENRYLSVIE